jgi:hypothetical protein
VLSKHCHSGMACVCVLLFKGDYMYCGSIAAELQCSLETLKFKVSNFGWHLCTHAVMPLGPRVW